MSISFQKPAKTRNYTVVIAESFRRLPLGKNFEHVYFHYKYDSIYTSKSMSLQITCSEKYLARSGLIRGSIVKNALKCYLGFGTCRGIFTAVTEKNVIVDANLKREKLVLAVRHTVTA